ncbi:phosphatase PAP2 family protein [Streptomyces sp. MST-110588]|uniref:phosphatase PAP2 family protein n=1 Tax=Streptomyces sp. MST-110588 TaxID=2833628 RepID=UPI001F5DD2D0|nr:phosphatase PAP2 family protein [Streptomyces sp. MST-110588]UNO42205.1 phosphatase PAP2 family protein [Streptomyces sp. MST-110588]
MNLAYHTATVDGSALNGSTLNVSPVNSSTVATSPVNGINGSSVDGSAYTAVVNLAHRTPGWLDSAISTWSAYGLVLFAALMAVAWWRARRAGTPAVVTALATPVIVLAAYAVNDGLKLLVREDRPCRSLHVITLETCPAPGDWSFPSNHAALAASTAVALLFVARGLGTLTLAAALAMAASRVWVGVHYPHDVAAGFVVGAVVALLLTLLVRTRATGVSEHLLTTRLKRLIATTTP